MSHIRDHTNPQRDTACRAAWCNEPRANKREIWCNACLEVTFKCWQREGAYLAYIELPNQPSPGLYRPLWQEKQAKAYRGAVLSSRFALMGVGL